MDIKGTQKHTKAENQSVTLKDICGHTPSSSEDSTEKYENFIEAI